MLRSLSRVAHTLGAKRFLSNGNQIWRPSNIRMGWSPKVISDLVPFTSETMIVRTRQFETIAVAYVPSKTDSSETRKTEDSWLEIILPFQDQPELRDSMVQSNGRTILYGKLLEILDTLAADVAYRHANGDLDNFTIVTASVDGFRAFENIDVYKDLKLLAYITYVGTSSMEVTIDLVSATRDGDESLVGKTQFIMAARDVKTGKAAKLPALTPCALLQDEFEAGRKRAQCRKVNAATSLSFTAPKPEEMSYMHKLYLESRNMMHNDHTVMQPMFRPNDIDDFETSKFIWFKNTEFRSVHFMHSQDRNIHGKIFGGHIMKSSFDLAWIAAVCYFGSPEPIFYCVDDIQFVRPVNIGSVMEYSTSVIYSEKSSIVVQVHACEVNYNTGKRTKTNILSFVFKAPQGLENQEYRQVMPREYDEFVLYLEGKRSFDRLMSEK